jgi:hypothetical protein
LLLGGYITGLIFFYENLGAKKDGTPRLKFRGPIHADGGLLNVGHWCAAPCLADFDGDGDLDLMSGNMPMHLTPEERAKQQNNFLIYFQNNGSRQDPQLHRVEFPGQGKFPRERLATPRAYDWDADGDLDLIVSARQNFYLFENQGTKTKPRFKLHKNALPGVWPISPWISFATGITMDGSISFEAIPYVSTVDLEIRFAGQKRKSCCHAASTSRIRRELAMTGSGLTWMISILMERSTSCLAIGPGMFGFTATFRPRIIATSMSKGFV